MTKIDSLAQSLSLAKKDISRKLAFDSKFINKQISKNKYQRPNIIEIIECCQSNCSLFIGGDITGTYQILTSFYGI